MKHTVKEFGRSDQLDATLGLDAIVASKLASIIVYAASIEYHLERALWVLEGSDPKGIRPKTDGKPATGLINMLQSRAKIEQELELQGMLMTWSEAAQFGFIIRHNIAHGVAGKVGSTMVVSRNPRWHGEERGRPFGKLQCEPSTLDLIRDSFATLLRVIEAVAQDRHPPAYLAHPEVMGALKQAGSILCEFADHFYNPSFEKY